MEERIITAFVCVRRGRHGAKARVRRSKLTDTHWGLPHHSSHAQSPITTASSTRPLLFLLWPWGLHCWITSSNLQITQVLHVGQLREPQGGHNGNPLLIPLSPVIHGNTDLPFHPEWTIPSARWPRLLVPCRSQMEAFLKQRYFCKTFLRKTSTLKIKTHDSFPLMKNRN